MHGSVLPPRIGLLAGLLFLPGTLFAQTVAEVQAGGSSLLGGYGATANFWRSGVDGWIGLGYLRGLRAGAFLREGDEVRAILGVTNGIETR